MKKPKFLPPSSWKNSKKTEQHQRYDNVYSNITQGAFESYETLNEGVICIQTSKHSSLLIHFWRDDICRVQHIHPYMPSYKHYALVDTAPSVKTLISIEENENYLTFASKNLVCKLRKKDCCLEFIDLNSQISILKETEPYTQRYSINKGVDQVKIGFHATKNDHFFGLGDKASSLNLQGGYFQNWNTDAFAYSKDSDPLYRSIPFYYGIKQGIAYGFFLNNSWKSHFDFNSTQNKQVNIWAEGGQMDYFILAGSKLEDVAKSYHHLTGTPELPPLWLLGFHQCRWSYYPQKRVLEVAEAFRENKIPCDAIYLDIDYMDEYRCFSWNKSYFPNPKKMIKTLNEHGIQTVVMIDPGIKVEASYPVFKSGIEGNLFCRRSNGELMQGPVWPTECVWPDFTQKEARLWWGKQYKKLYKEDGVSGFWNDMNEPAVFQVKSLTFPEDILHDNDGHPSDHRQAHNIYGQQMSKATYYGLKTLNPNKRPFVLTRASFSGGQRYAAVWTGDNIASWEHLRIANRQCQRLSISGFSLVGTDIGGFVDQPEPELYIRWLQLGIFHPLFRVHSIGNNEDGSAATHTENVDAAAAIDRLDREPWSFGEPFTTQARSAIEFRYRLLPYLYTSIYRHTRTGIPLLRSLSFEDAHDQQCLKRENEFLVGQHLLVNPVTKKGLKRQSTYLPQGEWLDFHTGKSYQGGRIVRKTTKANTIPIYVRSGAVIPQYPVQQYVNELDIKKVTLKVYFGDQNTLSYFYKDKGEGYDYKKGIFRLHSFITTTDHDSFTLTQTIEGTPRDQLTHFDIELLGFTSKRYELHIDDTLVMNIDQKIFTIAADFKKLVLK